MVAKLSEELMRGLVDFSKLAIGFGVTEIWITSVNEGKHRENSRHFAGHAVDIRSHDWPGSITESLTASFNSTHPDYQLLWEFRDSPNAHVHLEYDPGNRSR